MQDGNEQSCGPERQREKAAVCGRFGKKAFTVGDAGWLVIDVGRPVRLPFGFVYGDGMEKEYLLL